MAKLQDLALGKTARKRFSFSRKTENGSKEVVVSIEILTQLELDRARIDAAAWVETLDKKEFIGRSKDELLRDAEHIEVLSRSLRDPENPSEPWAGPSLMRQLLTGSEIALLAKAYEDHQNDCGPIIRNMTSEQFETLLTAIEEVGSTDPLVFFDWHTQRSFIVTLVRQHCTLRTVKSSGSMDSREQEELL